MSTWPIHIWMGAEGGQKRGYTFSTPPLCLNGGVGWKCVCVGVASYAPPICIYMGVQIWGCRCKGGVPCLLKLYNVLGSWICAQSRLCDVMWHVRGGVSWDSLNNLIVTWSVKAYFALAARFSKLGKILIGLALLGTFKVKQLILGILLLCGIYECSFKGFSVCL